MPPSPEVTAVEIARLAGVGRAAVSNWRKRHADFPQPVGGSEASPTFALPQVEDWLRRQGKIAELPLVERCRQQLDALRDPAGNPGAPLLPAGAFLLLLHRAPRRWAALAGEPDTRLALALPRAVAEVAGQALGGGALTLLELPALFGSTQLELCRMLARLAAEQGAAAAYEALLATSRQPVQLPPEAAALLLALAGEPASLLDPACGLGAVLRAAPADAVRHGQERDPVTAGAALLRLALQAGTDAPVPLPLHLAAGDALRADADPALLVDAVLCRPPYNERDWGYEELRYDPRWLFDQAPPRAEPELAWLLHCLAHTRPGGLTALLLPPTVASRRSGRRLRAELLRTGALRAVLALPAGAAPPYGVPLHLWLLRRPDPQGPSPTRRLLLLDATATQPEQFDWPTLHRTVLDGWQAFDAGAEVVERPGVHRVLDSIELLDDDTDLAPARHLPSPAPAGGASALADQRGRLGELLATLAELDRRLPAVAETGAGQGAPMTTLGELARAGALELFSSGAGPAVRPAAEDPSATPVLTEQDLAAGRRPSAALAGAGAPGEGAALLARPGDVLVAALGGGSVLVVRPGDPADGAALGARLHLLRPDPALLDPEFLAGRLRSTAGARSASSHASTTSRLDVRRVQVPRLPIESQRELGEAFGRIAAFAAGLRQAEELGRQLAQGLTDGLADGGLSVG
ncbi:N-6 DNA methylase [Kitasatospora sp. NPDC008050]|uniref:N-6 DNA methylase n=1 Tax=Kitasatospora sp. NPDC008050 TaxID=3364021 RepID=UPI0036EA126B